MIRDTSQINVCTHVYLSTSAPKTACLSIKTRSTASFCFSPTENQDELFDMIMKGHFEFPSPYWDEISASAKVSIQSRGQTFVE